MSNEVLNFLAWNASKPTIKKRTNNELAINEFGFRRI